MKFFIAIFFFSLTFSSYSQTFKVRVQPKNKTTHEYIFLEYQASDGTMTRDSAVYKNGKFDFYQLFRVTD